MVKAEIVTPARQSRYVTTIYPGGWPLLERAVDEKIEQQREFVGWWLENVRGPGKVNSRRTGRIGDADAEALTGITHQQVSKWRRWQ